MRAAIVSPLAVAAAVALAVAAPRVAAAKGCTEHSFVVGYQHCSQFGDWSRDQDIFPMQVEFGWFHEVFLAKPFTLSGDRVASPLGLVADGFAMRYLAGNGLVYGGLEMDWAFLSQMPVFVDQPGSGGVFAGRAVVGVHASQWHLGYGIELATGVRYTSLGYCPTKQACPDGFGQYAAILEARAHVDLFATPHFSISAMYGHSLVAGGDHMIMVALGGHFRALDGMY